MTEHRNWIAVASADHVARGRRDGFMQVAHGKAAPLRRVRPGDRIAYYSPTIAIGGKEPCRAFTALGIVRPGEPYQVDMGNEFRPFRRDVAWLPGQQAAIAPLLPSLSFTAGRANWGAPFRFGIFQVPDGDIAIIATAMGIAHLVVA